MKQQLTWLFSAGAILLSTLANAQWSTQSPVPTFLDVRGVAAPSAQRVFVATDDDSFDDGGALFESADGGTTWVQRNVPANLGSPLYGIFFLDANNGWAYGNNSYRTIDGGTTWSEMPFLGSTYFMEFYTGSFGLTTGNFGQYISRDGGLSWVPSPNSMVAFDFADDQTGLGISGSGIYRTTDGGNNFTLVQAGEAKAVTFLSATVAIAILDGNFVRSGDAGATWTTGETADGRSNLLPVSADIVLAWGRVNILPEFDDRIFRSADGGQSWSNLGEIMPAGVNAIATADQQSISACDLEGNMFYSGDAGLSWSMSFSSPGQRPGFLSSAVPVFPDPQTGYFGYGAGFIIKTTDGGASWNQISSGTGQSLNDLDRFPNGNLIAVGDDGVLLTSDGTSPWVLHEQFTTQDLMAVQVVGELEVVTVDYTGRVFGSNDGGSSWTASPAAPSGLNAADLHFTSLLDGWVAGLGAIGGALYHTTDGGTSWSAVPGFGGAYRAVDFEDQNGWAANVGGRYYRSSDNGANWVRGDLPGSSLQINDMDFFDASTGYAVGWYGYAARSNDGGVSWEVLPTPNTDDKFTDIYLLGPNELWLSTLDGVAYYSATGGQNWAILNTGTAGFGNFDAIVASPGGDAWTAGFQGYIERFAGPPPPPLNRPPDASFDFHTTGLSVDFTDTSSDPDGVVVSWAWDFGDGTGSTERNTSHTFAEANTYIVRLTVTDDDGDSNSAVRFIAVQPGPGGTFGDFTEVTPLDSLFVTPQDEDFWVITTAPADYDGDGDLDIAVLGWYVVYNQSVDERLVLVRNDGPATQTEWEFSYIDIPLDTLVSGSSDLAWGDPDGDGDLDLVVGSNGATVIYRNDAGVLTASDTQLPGYFEDNDQADFDLRSISWVDYDNDGDQDLLLPSAFNFNTFSFRTALMRNDGPNGNGGWIFTETDSVLTATAHAQSSWADFDGDQDLDLLLVNIEPLTDNSFIRRYRNDGSGIFVGQDILGAVKIEHGEAQWGDYDADGDLDILIVGHVLDTDGTYKQVLRIYRNDNETFVPEEVINCAPCEGWLEFTAGTWADYDSDGDMDILVAGTYNSGSAIEGRARVYTNNNGVFSDSGNELPAPRASGDRGGTFSWLDIDGDADLDYFIAGQYFVPGGNGLVESQMHVYRNDTPGQNAAPLAPSGLTAVVEADGTALLSWTAASDDHTPAAALTYNLDLFRNGAPLTLPRRVPEPGNVSAVTQWQLAGLADGQYEWAIRAVDASFNGGAVASGTFVVGDPTGVEPGDLVPAVFSFDQNYPNPFNPATTFSFALPARAHVELAVYNLQGQLVTRLVNEAREAGSHQVKWEAGGYASGAYFVRFIAPGFTKTRKVVLLK